MAAAKSNSRTEEICVGASAGVHRLTAGRSENGKTIVIEAGEVSDDAEETIDVVCDGSAGSVKVAHAIGAGSGHGAPERIFGGNFKFRINSPRSDACRAIAGSEENSESFEDVESTCVESTEAVTFESSGLGWRCWKWIVRR